jgi:ATP-dependent helicase/nuclease subunit A
LYNSIKNAVNVYRELRFNLKVPAVEVIANIPSTDDFVLVQGVIDCFIENSDGTYTVIDFKTDRVDKETGASLLKERYSGQLGLYCKAVEDITKKKVSKSVIFSFALMEEIPIER